MRSCQVVFVLHMLHVLHERPVSERRRAVRALSAAVRLCCTEDPYGGEFLIR